jgi:hypothetical protein
MKRIGLIRLAAAVVFAAGIFLAATGALKTQQRIQWSEQEKPIADRIGKLRSLPDDVRAHETMNLALEIRQLPAAPNKLRLADGLANLSTEGDFGRDTLQEVATTLASALREQPISGQPGKPPQPYVELAELVRYEHISDLAGRPAIRRGRGQN